MIRILNIPKLKTRAFYDKMSQNSLLKIEFITRSNAGP